MWYRVACFVGIVWILWLVRPHFDLPSGIQREIETLVRNDDTVTWLTGAAVLVAFFYVVCSQYESVVFVVSLVIVVTGIMNLPVLVWVASVLLATLLHLVFILIAPRVVKPSDSRQATVSWRWCRTCCLAVPPDVYHCTFCHGCVP